jgi:hypothetical protein
METTIEQAQPRYRAYCIANGCETTSEMWKYDGGSGHNFMAWINRQWREWEKANGRKEDSIHTAEDHIAFDEWLLKKVETEAKYAHAVRDETDLTEFH